MQQRFSLIQGMINDTNAIGEFKNRIRQLNEKYDIEQETFGIINTWFSHVPTRVHEGYMHIRKTFTNLEEALNDFSSINDVLYIEDSSTIHTGTYSNTILESKEDEKVIDLSTLKEI